MTKDGSLTSTIGSTGICLQQIYYKMYANQCPQCTFLNFNIVYENEIKTLKPSDICKADLWSNDHLNTKSIPLERHVGIIWCFSHHSVTHFGQWTFHTTTNKHYYYVVSKCKMERTEPFPLFLTYFWLPYIFDLFLVTLYSFPPSPNSWTCFWFTVF